MLDVWENDFDLLEEIQDAFEHVCKTFNDNSKNVNKIKVISKFSDCSPSENGVKKKRLTSVVLKKALDFKKGHVPYWIWEADEETQWQYVRGLLYANGTVFKSSSNGEPTQVSYSDINFNFLKQLQLLFNNLGLQSSIRLLRKAGRNLLPDGKGGRKFYDTKDCFRLVTDTKKAALEIEKYTGFLSRKKIKIEDKEYRDNSKKSYKVVSIQYVGEEDVYCPTVYNNENILIVND